MSLALALNNALSGLRVNQQSIGVLSQNVANVNTVGYSRQVINQAAITIEGIGSGVKIDDIVRKIDKYLQRSVQTQSSSFAASKSIDDYYQRIQALLGKPGASNSIDTYMTGFFNSMQQLAETPETTSLKSNAISSGVAIAKQLSDLAANVNDLRFEADSEISDAVTTVNNTLVKLEQINKALVQAFSLGQSTTGLLDERDKAVNTLSEYLNLSITYQESGSISIVGGNGVVLLEEGVHHRLRYSKAQSLNTFVEDKNLSALDVLTLNESGVEVGNPVQFFTAGKSSDVVSKLATGKLAALQEMRDVKFPAVLDQLDMLASRVRDSVNALHNKGSGYPPATTLTGDREVRANDQYSWQGTVRVAVLKTDGTPVTSYYSDETFTGIRPLLLDLGKLNSGQGQGKPTLQTIVDEINNHFGSPGNKAQVGNLNNIQLASSTNLLPSGATSLFSFDLDTDNISTETAQIFVTGMTVRDDTATNITNVTQAAPSISLQTTSSYSTTLGSADVTINLASAPTNLQVGDKIYLAPPSAASVNGIAAANLTGFFTVNAINGTQVTFTSGGVATSTGPVNDAGNIQMMPPYDHIFPGEQRRIGDNGLMQVDFTANTSSLYYDVTLNVSVIGADGVVHSSPVTYRVTNNENQIFNKRYDTTAVGPGGTLVLPGTSQESMRAILVDENGQELPTVNGKYIDAAGFLKLIGGNTGATYSVAIDEMDSQQLGRPDAVPYEAGTNWGFSHYFGLNDFFEPNQTSLTGDTIKGSAYRLKVQDRLTNDANLISTGNLVKMEKGVNTQNRELYTYARYSGDNSTIQSLSKLNTTILSFDAAGGLPITQLSLQSYSSQMIGYISQRSTEASDNATNAKVLYEGFKSKSDAISGVNLDEELANTVVLQNAYSASARVITIVNKMYDDLLSSV